MSPGGRWPRFREGDHLGDRFHCELGLAPHFGHFGDSLARPSGVSIHWPSVGSPSEAQTIWRVSSRD
jgi:hypothetical protein